MIATRSALVITEASDSCLVTKQFIFAHDCFLSYCHVASCFDHPHLRSVSLRSTLDILNPCIWSLPDEAAGRASAAANLQAADKSTSVHQVRMAEGSRA